jgi:hypothetical protein
MYRRLNQAIEISNGILETLQNHCDINTAFVGIFDRYATALSVLKISALQASIDANNKRLLEIKDNDSLEREAQRISATIDEVTKPYIGNQDP